MKRINNSKESLYSTTDMALAAAISIFYPIEIINKNNPKRVVFIFKKDKHFDLFIANYWKGKLKIDPQKYFQNLKLLKSRIYND